MPTDDPFRLQVTDVTGCVVFSLDTTLRDLKAEQDLTITIREEDVAKCLSTDRASPIGRNGGL